MNKKVTIAGLGIIALTGVALTLVSNINTIPLLAGNPLPNVLNCSYYFDSNNGYTSIKELNRKILNSESTADYKTWGTITNKYTTGSGSSRKTCYYVQSTDAYGEKGGILIYNAASTTLNVGNVVTIQGGTTSIYQNGAQITGAYLNQDYVTNPSPVEEIEATGADFSTSNMAALTERGPLFVKCTNATISNVSNTSANITLSDGTTVLAFYGSSNVQSAIRTKFENLNGSKTTVKGHIGRYQSSFQLYVRSDEYVGAGEVFLSYITVEKNDDTPYPVGAVPSITDFTVTAHYDDGSSRVVTNAEVDYYNTNNSGNGSVSFRYTEGNITKYDSVSINVIDDNYNQLQNYNLYGNWINIYYPNQEFQFGSVRAVNTNTNVYDPVLPDLTNFTTENVGHFTKTLSYETAMGNILTIDYEYYVAPVLYIDVPLNVVKVKQGEELDMFFVVVFDMSDISDYSSDKYLYDCGYYGDYDPYLTLSGYDTTVLGEQTVYVEWHGYTAQFQINVYKETQYIEPRSTVKTVYTTGESFEMPTMYFVDTNLGTEVDVTSKCEVDYFISSWTGTFTTTINYYNEELSKTFNYKVNYEVVEQGYIPTVSHIYVGNHKSNYKFGDAFETPEVYAYWTNGDETLADSNEVQFSGYDSCKLGRQEITCEYQGCYTSYEIYVTSNGTNQAFELSTSTLRLDKNYATGNYGSYNKIGYYRLAKSGSNFVLIPYSSISDGSIDIDSRNGSLYSYDSFKDIQTIQLTYSTIGSGSVKPYISYGEQTLDGAGKQTLEFSSSSTTVTLDLSSKNANYFKIDGGDVRFTIQSLYIEYTGENTPNGDSIIRDDNFTNYRINPTVFTGTLEDGVSSVTVPVDADIEGSSYQVTDVKTYTYYTLSYASSHTDMINSIAMTDPVDVANYYTIFQEFPANYCLSSDWSSTYAIFGDKTRCVSEYSRTDGYALSVPYAPNPSTNKPLYYEFDIALDSSYNNNSRGVGRVVAWKYGFNATGYDSNPVCTYTDDHYATFMEFNNLGGWNKRFDAQQMFTLVNWKNSVVLH